MATRMNTAHKYGEGVAKAILEDRKFDPGANAGGYVPRNVRNSHRPDPDNPTQGFHGPIYRSGFQRVCHYPASPTGPPPADATAVYQASLKQVRFKGIKPEMSGTLPDTATLPRWA